MLLSIEVLLVLGSLHYLTLTRTNIAFSINVKVCQLLHKPTIDHWVYTKRILKHIKQDVDLVLKISQSSSMVASAYCNTYRMVAWMIEGQLMDLLYFLVSNLVPCGVLYVL